MRRSLRALLRLPALLAPAVLIPTACLPPVPGLDDEPAVSLRTYRDSLLDLDLGYPEGWVISEKKTLTFTAATHDLTFQPMDVLWTRRFLVKVMIPDRIPVDRTLADFKDEYLRRLAAGADGVRIEDTAWASLGGEPAYRARYATLMNGRPFTRHTDYLCLRGGRDVSLSFEVADEHADEDIVLYRSIAERFRFYRP